MNIRREWVLYIMAVQYMSNYEECTCGPSRDSRNEPWVEKRDCHLRLAVVSQWWKCDARHVDGEAGTEEILF